MFGFELIKMYLMSHQLSFSYRRQHKTQWLNISADDLFGFFVTSKYFFQIILVHQRYNIDREHFSNNQKNERLFCTWIKTHNWNANTNWVSILIQHFILIQVCCLLKLHVVTYTALTNEYKYNKNVSINIYIYIHLQ
jgi:hypothetical protein